MSIGRISRKAALTYSADDLSYTMMSSDTKPQYDRLKFSIDSRAPNGGDKTHTGMTVKAPKAQPSLAARSQLCLVAVSVIFTYSYPT